MTHPDSSPTPARVLVIVAHADDIEFGAAGSVARWTDEGAEVIYCIVTDGGAGSNEPGANLEKLVEQRRDEQIKAARLVGVNEVRFLGFGDGTLQPTLELRCVLTRLIRETKPDRVVCQDPTSVFFEGYYINHPDHRAAGEASIYAVFPSAGTRPIFSELLEEGFEPHNVKDLYLMVTTAADTVIDISDTFERKIEALLCHESQLGPEVHEWIEEWNAAAGKEHGYKFAEQFRVMRFERPGTESKPSPTLE